MSQKKIEDMTHEELVQSAKSLNMILEALPINLFVKDTECKYQLTSRVCDEINGVKRGGLKGKSDFDLQNSEEIAQSFFEDDKNIMVTKKGSRMLSPTLCGNAIKYYDIYKEPLIDEGENVAGILGLVIDPGDTVQMTERNENLVTQTEDELSDDDSFIFDYDIAEDKTLILKNHPNFSNLSQYDNITFEELLSLPIIADESRGPIIAEFQKLMEGKKQSSLVIYIKNANGDFYPCTLRMTNVFDIHMKPTHVIVILTALSEENVQEEEMQLTFDSLQERFTSIASSHYEIMLFIFSKYKQYRLITSSYKEIPPSGSTDDLLQHLIERIHPDDKTNLMTTFTSIVSGSSECKSIEIRMHSMGAYRWKEVHFHEAGDQSGAEKNFIITISDIDDMVHMRNEKEIRQVNNQLIDVLSSLVESRDLESGNHIHRIKKVTEILLKEVSRMYPEYALDDDEIDVIVAASAMHDIGKIAIPDTILLKPGKLTAEEFDFMKLHTVKGAEIINNASLIQDKKYYNYCYDICLHHHERFDGKGYPEGLKGDDISIAAQVVSVADVYDALVSKRCYKDAYSEDETIRMILDGECGCFNPKLMECLKKCREDLKKLYEIT